MPDADCQVGFLFEAKEKTELCVFFIRGFLVIASFRMAEVDDRNSRAAHEDIFPTDISVKNARTMDRR
jgi:hypothetical protein